VVERHEHGGGLGIATGVALVYNIRNVTSVSDTDLSSLRKLKRGFAPLIKPISPSPLKERGIKGAR